MGMLLTEPAIVPDIFVSGLAEAEDLGDGNFRFTMYTNQKCYRDGTIEQVVVARLVMPAPAVIASLKATMRVMGIACCGGERIGLRH